MKDNPYSVSVAGVICNADEKALLLQRPENGRWELPGGVLERDETIADGLRREVWEETGLRIRPGPITGIYQNLRHHVIALAFRCERIGGELTINDEASAFRWATAEEIPELTTEVFAGRLLDGIRSDDRPAIRYHAGINLL